MRKQYGLGWNPYAQSQRRNTVPVRVHNTRNYKPPAPEPEHAPTCGDAVFAWLETESDQWLRSTLQFERGMHRDTVYVKVRAIPGHSGTIGYINLNADHLVIRSFGKAVNQNRLDYSDPKLFEDLEHGLRLLYNTTEH